MDQYVGSVSQINEYVSNLLSRDPLLTGIGVRGEISGFKRHSSGHLYFTLKDENAQIRCVMFRQYAMMMDFRPVDGVTVTAFGSVSLYVKDGQYQLYVKSMQEQGEGELYRRFMLLKTRLQASGLFDEQHKKQLPFLPRCVGVITSDTGAVFHDIKTVILRRFPGMNILLSPVRVQGPGAAEEIAAAIVRMNRQQRADVLIVGRGGGSIEDLWAFNEEIVARAIYQSELPIISAVGHETDFTIADFVADMRAPTPSAAAEIAVPEEGRLRDDLKKKLIHINRSVAAAIREQRKRVLTAGSSGVFARLEYEIARQKQKLLYAKQLLLQSASGRTKEYRQHILHSAERLNVLDPYRVLDRGYAMVTDTEGKILSGVGEMVPEQDARLILNDGRADIRIVALSAAQERA
ncbi:MAG: exodeoxyribonuclease VII large subunit [Bacillota bacterium]